MQAPQKVLVVSLRYFGDALLAASLAQRIKEHWPECEITYLVYDHIAQILQGIPDIDRVVTVPPRPSKLSQFFWMASHWREYDIAFITQRNHRPFWYGWFMGKRSVCPHLEFDAYHWWQKILMPHSAPPAEDPDIQLLFVHSVLSGEGFSTPQSLTVPAPSAGGTLPTELANAGAYVVLHPVLKSAFKEWPFDHWVELIRRLQQKGYRIAITGGTAPKEVDYLDSLKKACPDILLFAGKLSFGQTADLIRGAHAYIGVDTGTTHVAAATGTPTIAIFGPTSAHTWGPWAPGQSEPYARRPDSSTKVQARGSVRLIQKFPYPRCPCGQKGCENCNTSRSDCLNNLTADEVLRTFEYLMTQN